MSNGDRKLGCWFYGCATCLVLAVVGIGACVMVFQYGRRSVVPVADGYLDHVQRGEFAQAYEGLGESWRERQSLAEFTASERDIQERLGSCPERSVSGVRMSTTGEGAIAEVSYRATCERGDATVTVTLRKAGRSWDVHGVNYDAADIREDVVCPSCGAVSGESANYCSQCGSELVSSGGGS